MNTLTLDTLRTGTRVTTTMRDFGPGTITGDHRWPSLGDRFTVRFDGQQFDQPIAIESAGRFTLI